ncbi:MAG: hypothetical protein JNN07_26315 [Verrucomicrobiales bacterium]|nr:hypothetical protein [Verrucomicrobiales bacterium]
MNHPSSRRYLAGLVGVLWTVASQPEAMACATCFGQTDSPLGRGLNWGIFALLVVVTSVLGGICSFFVFIARRTARVESEQLAGALSQAEDSTLSKTV